MPLRLPSTAPPQVCNLPQQALPLLKTALTFSVERHGPSSLKTAGIRIAVGQANMQCGRFSEVPLSVAVRLCDTAVLTDGGGTPWVLPSGGADWELCVVGVAQRRGLCVRVCVCVCATGAVAKRQWSGCRDRGQRPAGGPRAEPSSKAQCPAEVRGRALCRTGVIADVQSRAA